MTGADQPLGCWRLRDVMQVTSAPDKVLDRQENLAFQPFPPKRKAGRMVPEVLYVQHIWTNSCPLPAVGEVGGGGGGWETPFVDSEVADYVIKPL